VTSLGNAVGVILGLLTLIAAATSVVAVLRANLAKATIEVLKDSNDAFETRVDQLEAENDRFLARMTALETENASLRSLVTGVDEIKRFRTEFDAHRSAVKDNHDRILTGMYAVHDLMMEELKRLTTIEEALRGTVA
jgi:hypothetical protein